MTRQRPLRILVVDDDPAMVGAITALVGTEGHQVITAYDGRSAVRRFEDESPDLVLLDLAMPAADGFAVVNELRAAGSPPIIVVSGESASASKVRALQMGADDYVTKPFGKDELLARIAAVMRRATGEGSDRQNRGAIEVGPLVADRAGSQLEGDLVEGLRAAARVVRLLRARDQAAAGVPPRQGAEMEPLTVDAVQPAATRVAGDRAGPTVTDGEDPVSVEGGHRLAPEREIGTEMEIGRRLAAGRRVKDRAGTQRSSDEPTHRPYQPGQRISAPSRSQIGYDSVALPGACGRPVSAWSSLAEAGAAYRAVRSSSIRAARASRSVSKRCTASGDELPDASSSQASAFAALS